MCDVTKGTIPKNCTFYHKMQTVVAKSAFKIKFSFKFNSLNYIYRTYVHIYERMSIFYEVVLKISRLYNHIF